MSAFSRFSFTQDPDGAWFVVLPDYPGLRQDLEMVQGADLLLSALSNAFAPDPSAVTLVVSQAPFSGHHGSLTRTAILAPEEGGGASYVAKLVHVSPFPVWLCDVLKYALGDFPEKIYFCAESL